MPILGSNSHIIGTKLDEALNPTLMGKLDALIATTVVKRKCFPSLAPGVQMTSGASWVLGAAYLIMPANTANRFFSITHISIDNLTPTGFMYEMILYNDMACTIGIGSARISTMGGYQFGSPILDNTMPVYGKIACLAAGAKLTASIIYGEI